MGGLFRVRRSTICGCLPFPAPCDKKKVGIELAGICEPDDFGHEISLIGLRSHTAAERLAHFLEGSHSLYMLGIRHTLLSHLDRFANYRGG
jgi:hypothetical protein